MSVNIVEYVCGMVSKMVYEYSKKIGFKIKEF